MKREATSSVGRASIAPESLFREPVEGIVARPASAPIASNALGDGGDAARHVAVDPPAAPVEHAGREVDTAALFTVGVTNREGRELDPDACGFSNPCVREARGLVFSLTSEAAQPTAGEMALYRDVTKMEHALRELYPDDLLAREENEKNEKKFRPYFVRLYYLARLALEGRVRPGQDGKKVVGKRLPLDAATAELNAIGGELIDDEAPRIKNGHLRHLAWSAGSVSMLFLLAYVALRLGCGDDGGNTCVKMLSRLYIQPRTAANFMLLWVGTCAGVCLSYAIRTQTFSIVDLTRTDGDYWSATIRLLLAGAFATILALFSIVGLGDLELGSIKLSMIASDAMVAFALGIALGIGQQRLFGIVGTRAGELFPGPAP